MALSSLDYRTIAIDGKTRKIKLQDVADKIRLILLPTAGRFRVTIGPLYGTDGKTVSTSNVMGYALGASGAYTNNASSPTVADEVIRGDLDVGESREITLGFIEADRPKELVLWSDLADAYCEVCFDAVEGR